jgi:hypothetical protein
MNIPEVGGEVGAREVVARNAAVALHAPSATRSSDVDHPTLIITSEDNHNMAADIGLPLQGAKARGRCA